MTKIQCTQNHGDGGNKVKILKSDLMGLNIAIKGTVPSYSTIELHPLLDIEHLQKKWAL